MKMKIIFLVIIAILILSTAGLNAQVKDDSFSVSPVIGYSCFVKSSDFEDTSVYGASFGYNFSQYFGVEATYNALDTKIKSEGITEAGSDPDGPGPEQGELIVVTPGGTKLSGDQYRIEALCSVYPGKKFAPYVAVGIGRLDYEYQGRNFSQMNAPIGFGFKYFVTDKVAIRADIRNVLPVHDNNILAAVGVTFQFGGR